MIDNTQIGNRLKNARMQKQLKQSDVANAIGIATSTIARYENGQIEKLKLPVIEAISRYLEVNPAWIIGKSSTRELEQYENNVEHIIKSWIDKHPKEFDEQMLIVAYRPLDDADKEIIWDTFRNFYKSDKYKDVDFTL